MAENLHQLSLRVIKIDHDQCIYSDRIMNVMKHSNKTVNNIYMPKMSINKL